MLVNSAKLCKDAQILSVATVPELLTDAVISATLNG